MHWAQMMIRLHKWKRSCFDDEDFSALLSILEELPLVVQTRLSDGAFSTCSKAIH